MDGPQRLGGSWSRSYEYEREVVVAPGVPTVLSRLLGVSLESLEPGEHELVLNARDEVTGAEARSVEPFRVEP